MLGEAMKKIIIAILSTSAILSAKETSSIPKDQFCHFSYSIYQSCYQRGIIPGTYCEQLAEGIKFG